jgi:hypothetical protein
VNNPIEKYLNKKPFWEFICPVCKTVRRSTYWPSPRPKHYLALIIFTIFITYVFWNYTGLKGLFLFFVFWPIFEFFYRLFARQALICPHCGFDPYLYKYNVDLARKKIEDFFKEKTPNLKQSSESQSQENQSNKENEKKEAQAKEKIQNEEQSKAESKKS